MQPGHEELIICFVNIRNWGRGVRKRSDDSAFELLTDLYEKVLPIAEEHEGRIVKVMGDGALIIWKPEHATEAVSAVKQMRSRFDDLQEVFKPDRPMSMAAALTLGPAIAREMGPPSIRRWDVIGEPVNCAVLLNREHDFVITQSVADAAEMDLSDIAVLED